MLVIIHTDPGAEFKTGDQFQQTCHLVAAANYPVVSEVKKNRCRAVYEVSEPIAIKRSFEVRGLFTALVLGQIRPSAGYQSGDKSRHSKK